MITKIAGIWERTKENGEPYLKGRVETPFPIIVEPGTEVVLFKSKSTHPSAPAYDLMLDTPRPKQQNGGAGA